MTNPALIDKINRVEASFGLNVIELPACLAESIKEVLDAASKEGERIGAIAGRAAACGAFLGECLKAQSNN